MNTAIEKFIDSTLRQEALMKFLGVEEHEVFELDRDSATFGYCDQEYLVLLEDEADAMAKDRIRQELWSFRQTYLVEFMECADDLSMRETEDLEKQIEKMQGELCESCNEIIYGLIKNKYAEFESCTLSNEGRGHFLAPYDFEENEQDDYFIYRVN